MLWAWYPWDPWGAQTLPRHILYEPRLKQLVYRPVEELEGLRGPPLFTLNSSNSSNSSTSGNATLSNSDLGGTSGTSGTSGGDKEGVSAGPGAGLGAVVPRSIKILGGSVEWIGSWGQRGNQSEIVITFKRPTEAAVLGIDVMCGATSSTSSTSSTPTSRGIGSARAQYNASTRIFVNYSPARAMHRVGVASGAFNLTRIMNHTNLHGGDVRHTQHCPSAASCAASCLAASTEAWTWNKSSHVCTLKDGAATRDAFIYDSPANPANINLTSGVAQPGPGDGPADELSLLESDDEIRLHLFLDRNMLEVFFQVRKEVDYFHCCGLVHEQACYMVTQ